LARVDQGTPSVATLSITDSWLCSLARRGGAESVRPLDTRESEDKSLQWLTKNAKNKGGGV